MISSSRYKWLVFLLVVLLATNFTLLYLYVKKDGGKSPNNTSAQSPANTDRPHGSKTAELLQNEVGFSEEQVQQYFQLREAHWKNMRPYFESMRSAKDSFYSLLRQDSISSSDIKMAATRIGLRQQDIDMATMKHFQEVKKLCTPEQKIRFDAFVKEVIRKMTMTRSPRNRNEEGKKDSINSINNQEEQESRWQKMKKEDSLETMKK